MSCISGFMNDVLFSHNAAVGTTETVLSGSRVLKVTHRWAASLANSDVYDFFLRPHRLHRIDVAYYYICRRFRGLCLRVSAHW